VRELPVIGSLFREKLQQNLEPTDQPVGSFVYEHLLELTDSLRPKRRADVSIDQKLAASDRGGYRLQLHFREGLYGFRNHRSTVSGHSLGDRMRLVRDVSARIPGRQVCPCELSGAGAKSKASI
jgi:hypothetical protein